MTGIQESHFKMQLNILATHAGYHWERARDYINAVLNVSRRKEKKDFEEYMGFLKNSDLKSEWKEAFYKHFNFNI